MIVVNRIRVRQSASIRELMSWPLPNEQMLNVTTFDWVPIDIHRYSTAYAKGVHGSPW